MGKSMNLDVSDTDIEELVKDYKEELKTGEPVELQHEQQKVLMEEHSTEEEEDRKGVSWDIIKSLWNNGMNIRISLRSITATYL